jgi:hypothetical protein
VARMKLARERQNRRVADVHVKNRAIQDAAVIQNVKRILEFADGPAISAPSD